MPPRQGGRLDRRQRRSLGDRAGTVRRTRTPRRVATIAISSSSDAWLPAPPAVPAGNDAPLSGLAHRSTAIRPALLGHDSRLRPLDPGNRRARRGGRYRRPRGCRRHTGGRATSGQEPGNGHRHGKRPDASHPVILHRGSAPGTATPQQGLSSHRHLGPRGRPATRTGPPPVPRWTPGPMSTGPRGARSRPRCRPAQARCPIADLTRSSPAGSGGETRTHNPLINSQMLCRLSYPGKSAATPRRPWGRRRRARGD